MWGGGGAASKPSEPPCSGGHDQDPPCAPSLSSYFQKHHISRNAIALKEWKMFGSEEVRIYHRGGFQPPVTFLPWRRPSATPPISFPRGQVPPSGAACIAFRAEGDRAEMLSLIPTMMFGGVSIIFSKISPHRRYIFSLLSTCPRNDCIQVTRFYLLKSYSDFFNLPMPPFSTPAPP